ncbi:MAG: DUF2188 domain-containing protein [Thermoanaerobaculia bacterium]
MSLEVRMAGRNAYHVIADLKGGWAVVRGGAERASRRFASQADAIEWGQRISRDQKTEFVVHRKDGTIARRDLYGQDPGSPRSQS